MELTVEYLRQRHAYWIERLADAGIWEADKFKPVELVVRERCKSYFGLFHRKWVKVNVRRRLRDRIIVYRQSADMSVEEIDGTLVHEMIHQYIFQNDLPDTSTHGRLFKDFMQRINEAFPQELKISIYGESPILKGPGTRTHKLILLWMNDGSCFCCKITPTKVPLFVKLIEKNKLAWKLKGYLLCESNDLYFDTVPACRKYLHGLSMSLPELREFCKEYDIKRI
ncbi:MAG: SprT-like domain-containing protein [Muribaculum sp.]|nr:SprT-like domain-containing protein [Muribaculum sp.]